MDPRDAQVTKRKTTTPPDELTSEQLVDAFLTYAERDRGWRADTLRRYATVLTRLDGVADWTLEDADAWWSSRRDMSPRTRENELAVLRSFFKWMTRWDHRADDPTRRLVAPKIEQTVVKYPARPELLEHLKAAHDEDEHVVRRTLALMAYAGLRVGEAARATAHDIDRENARILIHGKGGKERWFGLSQALLDEILPLDHRGNIVTAGEAPATEGVLQRKVNRWLERHGSEFTCHAFRKRAASLAGKRVNAAVLASAMGWSSVNTAATYVGGDDEDLAVMAAATASETDNGGNAGLEMVAEALRAVGMADAAEKLLRLIRGEDDDDADA